MSEISDRLQEFKDCQDSAAESNKLKNQARRAALTALNREVLDFKTVLANCIGSGLLMQSKAKDQACRTSIQLSDLSTEIGQLMKD